ncbi:MAG TPA: lysylphosphatidylglycerol synthase transmembrane domain-containing protein [Thermoleophilaceae bacterium]|nr:lysylphosphatidylglycerol synthase transmembrane domain-containing protein [Thermoleophilaceae bacterium]
MRRWLRSHPIVASALATLIAAGGVLLIAWITGADELGRAFESVQPGWIALIAGAELLTYPAYALAYRSVAQVHGHAPLELPIVGRVVAAGFGPFAVAGGFGLDKQLLHAVHEDARSARVRVLGLGILEWAALAPLVCVISIVFLIQGANILPSLLWPWAIAVPVGFGFALWASAPKRRERICSIGGKRRIWLADLLDGVGVLHTLISQPRKYAGAWVGSVLYWAADIAAFYGALRMFGLDMHFGKVVLAYATGYAATRRSLPLGGAGVTEVLMSYALYWVRQPLAPALAAVIAYRAFNFLLAALPALIARRHLHDLLESADELSRRAA